MRPGVVLTGDGASRCGALGSWCSQVWCLWVLVLLGDKATQESSPAIQYFDNGTSLHSMGTGYIRRYGGKVRCDEGGRKVRCDEGGGKVRSDVHGGKVRSDEGGGNMRSDESGGKVRSDEGGGKVRSDVHGGKVRSDEGGGNVRSDEGGGKVRVMRVVGR